MKLNEESCVNQSMAKVIVSWRNKYEKRGSVKAAKTAASWRNESWRIGVALCRNNNHKVKLAMQPTHQCGNIIISAKLFEESFGES
jgi:hypothetical protein